MNKPKHVGQWLNVDGGPVHLLADANMSAETANALAELVRAARKQMADRKPDMEALKAFDLAALLDTLEHYLSALNFDYGKNTVLADAGYLDWQSRHGGLDAMYALRDAELLEMRYVRDRRGVLISTEYRITTAGIRYLQEHRP